MISRSKKVICRFEPPLSGAASPSSARTRHLSFLSSQIHLRFKPFGALAVKSDPKFWIQSLTDGKFETPPAVRLMGTAGKKREGTKEEIAAWQDHIKHRRGTKGYNILWKNMRMVRNIHFDSFEPVLCGAMTKGLWE